MPPSRAVCVLFDLCWRMMKIRSFATVDCEPCQAGNRAALSRTHCVPQECRVRVRKRGYQIFRMVQREGAVMRSIVPCKMEELKRAISIARFSNFGRELHVSGLVPQMAADEIR